MSEESLACPHPPRKIRFSLDGSLSAYQLDRNDRDEFGSNVVNLDDLIGTPFSVEKRGHSFGQSRKSA